MRECMRHILSLGGKSVRKNLIICSGVAYSKLKDWLDVRMDGSHFQNIASKGKGYMK